MNLPKSVCIVLIAITIILPFILAAPAETNESRDAISTEKPTTKAPKEDSTETPEVTSLKNTSTFTCYGRLTGYYADVKLNCRVYHFCTQIEALGTVSYQRMSYICLEGSIFDQKDLSCVKEADLKVSCDKAEAEYEISNKEFNAREEAEPSMSDNLAANIMMNPLTRFIAGR